MKYIRNFCIIAHVDHGKSTLADRLIQACDGVSQRDFRDQLLDSMDIEGERGITIKSNTIALNYRAADGQDYLLNLIDTPGHVDFSHEVRRSLLACDGALIVVDASQGVEAQTVANLYLVLDHNLELLPVINKIDLPAADVDRVREEIEKDLGLDPFAAIPISAKTGVGIPDVLAGIVEKLPPPEGDPAGPLKMLVFDGQFDRYRGVILQCRIMDGTVKQGDQIHFMHSGWDYMVEEVGINKLKFIPKEQAHAPARWATSSPGSRACGRLRSATPLRTSIAPPPSRCPATRGRSRSSFPRFTRSTPTSTASCKRRWTSWRSTMPP